MITLTTRYWDEHSETPGWVKGHLYLEGSFAFISHENEKTVVFTGSMSFEVEEDVETIIARIDASKGSCQCK